MISYIGLVAVWTGMGLLLKGPLDHTAIVRSDRRVARWFADHRTPNLNHYTVWGSDLADTFVVVEKWESTDALKAHSAAPHMAAYAAKTRENVASRVIHVLSPT